MKNDLLDLPRHPTWQILHTSQRKYWIFNSHKH